jgi:cell division GTPase FtsZ
MSLNRDEIKEQYKWLTSGSKECIVLKKKDYESFMDDERELSIIKVDGCDAEQILKANEHTFKNAESIIISFKTSVEFSFLTMSMFVESLTEGVDESCEVLFTSHPDEAMSDDVCHVTLLVNYNNEAGK